MLTTQPTEHREASACTPRRRELRTARRATPTNPWRVDGEREDRMYFSKLTVVTSIARSSGFHAAKPVSRVGTSALEGLGTTEVREYSDLQWND
jgi:hypothetical protein